MAIIEATYSDLEAIAVKAEGFTKRIRKVCRKAQRRGCETLADAALRTLDIADAAERLLAETISEAATEDDVTEWLLADIADAAAGTWFAPEDEGFRPAAVVCAAANIWLRFVSDRTSDLEIAAEQTSDRFADALADAMIGRQMPSLFEETAGSIVRGDSFAAIHAGVAAQAGFAETAARLPAENLGVDKSESSEPEFLRQESLIAADTRIADAGTDLPDYESAIRYIADKAEELSVTEGGRRKVAGDQWEKIVAEFLRTDPVYKKTFAKVWLWSEYSNDKDIGIDIVAETFDGKKIAIQCKFSGDPDRSLQKGAIDSFIATTDTKEWAGRYIFWSGFKISKHIDKQIMEDRQVPLKMITGAVLRTSNTAWAELATTGKGTTKPLKKPRGYQTKAIADVEKALDKADRTKLIMACGSGKTFTSQMAAERIASEGGTVLYIVPSIALMGQTMREWSEQEDPEGRGLKHSFMGVCSDSGTGKNVTSDGIGGMHKTDIAQLEMPVGTDPKEIAAMMKVPVSAGYMRTVFSTYQSLPKIRQAQQKHGAPVFDLMFCDEAHRTTGMGTAAGEDEGHFQMPHKEIQAAKRIYMTATPKVFGERLKKKADLQGRAIYTMNDEEIFGGEAFRLSFSDAIEQHVLADYKVHIVQVAENMASEILNHFTASEEHGEIADSDRKAMLKTDVAARLVGLWQALVGAEGVRTNALQKSIVYLDTIRNSKAFAAVFPAIAEHLSKVSGISSLPVKVKHVDGQMSATTRQQHLSWLDSANIEGEIRLLSNAKCLSEGVDVPSLDGVAFMVPKGSIVDIVQSVGRVIRAAPLKKYGHVVLPALLPTTVTSKSVERHLSSDAHWATTWQVLRALRSHDDKFANEIAIMELHEGEWPDRIVLSLTDSGTGLDGFCIAGGQNIERTESGASGNFSGAETDSGSDGSGLAERVFEGTGDSDFHLGRGTQTDRNSGTAPPIEEINGTQGTLDLAAMMEHYPDEVMRMLQDGVFSVTLDKVGDRQYWDSWGKDAAEAFDHVLGRLENYKNSNREFAEEITATTAGLASTLGDFGDEAKTLHILAQYIIVRPVFEALFGTAEGFDDSPLSETMKSLSDTVAILDLDSETSGLEDFYQHIAEKARNVKSEQDRQVLIKRLYEDFIHQVFPKEAKQFGVVYTPNEIVDFTLRSVDWAIKEHLGIEAGIADEAVDVLDPFSGTGTFLVNLVQNKDLIPDDKLAYKFSNNLHSSEIMALPYWATELNLEQAYMARTDGEYLPYNKGVLADTFSMGKKYIAEQKAQQSLQFEAMKENINRYVKQDETPITCIVGNPPWAVGNTGDWKELQDRVSETYSARTNVSSKQSLNDSYILAMRWVSDRIGDRGVIGFVTNNSWLSSNAGAGVRRTLEEEFDHIYVLDMLGKGGAATTPDQRAVQGGNVFNVTVGNSVVILVRTGSERTAKTQAVYADTKGLSAEDKTAKISATKHIGDTAGGLEWHTVQSDYRGDWIDQGHPDWRNLITVGDKNTKAAKDSSSVIQMYSSGLKTGMAAHSMGSSKADVLARGVIAADEFNDMIVTGTPPPKTTASGVNYHKELKEKLEKEQTTENINFVAVSESDIIKTMGSPWLPQYALYHKTFNSRQYRIQDINDADSQNMFICVNGRGSPSSQTFLSNTPPDLNCLSAGTQALARYRLEEDGSTIEASDGNGSLHGTKASDGRVYVDNILDEFLTAFRENYSDESIVKDDIFFYMYGMLHHPGYRDKYGNDLVKDLPRMPYAPDFWGFSNAGKQLANIHANYDSLDGWDGDMDIEFSDDFDPDNRSHWRVTGAKWEDNGSTLVLNDRITIRNIPAGAHTYKIAGKSPIQQFAADTKVSEDSKTGIVNDVNDLYNDNPAETLLRARQLIEVGVRSSEVLAGLPEEFE